MATTGKGIFYPTVTDTVKPASRDMRQLAQTTDVAIETARQQAVDEAKWTRRSLTNGEDMNTVTEPGLYWSNSYTLTNTLINAPRFVGAVERAVCEVKTNAVGQVSQSWIALGVASAPTIQLSRRRDSADQWSGWESDRWVQRLLTVGEDMNDLVQPGLYLIPSYTVADSLVNGSRVRNTVQKAAVEVATDGAGSVLHTWKTMNPVTSEDSPIATRRRDESGAWSEWSRMDGADIQPYVGLPGTATHQSQEGTLRLIAAITEDNGEPWRWIAPTGAQQVTPTHEGSGQATHPSVLYFPDRWNGWHYWMAMTPYPWGNEDHEDPDILVSDDGDTWQVPAGLTNPLDDQPGAPGPHNSDTHLVMLPDGRMMVTWRMVDRPNDSTNIFYQRISSDGVTWTAKQVLFRATATTGFVSQSLVRVDGRWRLYGVASGAIIYYESTAAVPGENDWGPRITCPNTGAGIARRWWHLDVQLVDGRWWMLVSDVRRGSTADGNLYLGVSEDGHTWDISPTPVVPKVAANHDTLYKAGFVITSPTGIDIWYSAFRRDSIEWHIYRTTANRITSASADLLLPATPSTGLRNITGMFSEVTSGRVGLSRVGSGVTLSFDGVVIPTASSGFHHLSQFLPPGFRPLSGTLRFESIIQGATQSIRLRIVGKGQVTVYSHDGSSGLYGSIFFSTVDEWPTVLPGTLA